MDNRNQEPLQILLGVDGSDHSMSAIQLLQDLPLAQAAPSGCTITVLAVLHLQHAARRHLLEAVLDDARQLLSRTGIEVQTGLIHGNPAGELIHYAEQHNPSLIVLGALGLRATLGILLGGVAQQVVEYARCPVLIVRAPYAGLRRVLIATDGSASSQKGVCYLCGQGDAPCLPLPSETALHLVHVLPPLIQPEMYARTWPVAAEALPYISDRELEEASQRQAEEEEAAGVDLLEKTAAAMRQALPETMLGKLETVLLRGDAATEIIHYVKANQIDLILAGSRGLSQVRSWLLGSVSRKLVHYSGCSVLVVK
jgi:nucleotide-binding universal stress UspA family protein